MTNIEILRAIDSHLAELFMFKNQKKIKFLYSEKINNNRADTDWHALKYTKT